MPLNNDAEHHIKNKTTLCRWFRYYIRYYWQNVKSETSFNAPVYLMFLRYNDIICICSIFKTSRLHLILYYMEMIFLYIYFFNFTGGDVD